MQKVTNGYKVSLISCVVCACWAARLFFKGGETTQASVDHQISIYLIYRTEILESYFLLFFDPWSKECQKL